MILADTSVWIEHLNSGKGSLNQLLESGEVGTHPFVIGELACGSIKNRREILHLLDVLPAFPLASNSEVRDLIESRRLYSKGIGWVDAHLIAAVLLSPHSKLLTKDKRLGFVADEIL